jgi:hypothetical protein
MKTKFSLKLKFILNLIVVLGLLSVGLEILVEARSVHAQNIFAPRAPNTNAVVNPPAARSAIANRSARLIFSARRFSRPRKSRRPIPAAANTNYRPFRRCPRNNVKRFKLKLIETLRAWACRARPI